MSKKTFFFIKLKASFVKVIVSERKFNLRCCGGCLILMNINSLQNGIIWFLFFGVENLTETTHPIPAKVQGQMSLYYSVWVPFPRILCMKFNLRNFEYFFKSFPSLWHSNLYPQKHKISENRLLNFSLPSVCCCRLQK